MEQAVSIVVPVYNSEGVLRELVRRIEPVLGMYAEYELLLVNDGSRDRSWDVIRELAATHPWIRGLDMARNYGQHNALLCGIRKARYDVVVTLDDDLQNPPEEIPKLLARLEEGYDVVYGTPDRERHGIFRNVASRFTKFALQNAMGISNARSVSAYRAFRTRLRDAFVTYHAPYVSIDVLLSWGTSRFGSVSIRHDRRMVGASNYSLRTLVDHALNMTTGFSTWPLRLATAVGFVFTCIGVLMLAIVVVSVMIHGREVPGFSFLASALAIFSGAQLFALGIIGEYLARMFHRSLERPPYVVRSAVGATD